MDELGAYFLRAGSYVGDAVGIERPAEVAVVLGLVDRRIGRAVDDKVDLRAFGRAGRDERVERGRISNVDFAVGADKREMPRFKHIGKLGAEHALVSDKPNHILSPAYFVSFSERSGFMPISGHVMAIAGSFHMRPPSSSG